MIIKSSCCSVFPADLAPGNDQIYEEKQENFLTAGNPQDGQVILYKVGAAKTSACLWIARPTILSSVDVGQCLQ